MGNSNQTLKNVNQTQNVLEEIRNNTLIGINLENQKIGIEGAKVLANALEENSSVTDIILDSNIIGDEGVTALANALEKNKTVTKIYLSHNNIGNEGARVLASALEKNTTLKKIDLSSNFISREGAEVLINALKKNKTLVYIDISKNKISESDSIALAIDLKGDIRARINLSDWDRVIEQISYVPIVGDILKGVPLSSPMKFEKAQTIKMINSKQNVKQKVTHTVAAVQQKVEVSKNILPEQKILYNQVMKQVSIVAESKIEEAYAKEGEQVQEVDMNAVLKEVGTQTKLNAQDIEILQDMLMEERAARMEEKAAREKMQEELDQLKKLLLKNS